jgi:SSS family solute:Na+ symporter
VEKEKLDRFFGKLHTPVQPTDSEDAAMVEKAAHHPEHFEGKKIWPGSQWEILKPGWIDVVGFGGSCVMVIVVLWVLWTMAGLGS